MCTHVYKIYAGTSDQALGLRVNGLSVKNKDNDNLSGFIATIRHTSRAVTLTC